MLHTIFCIFIFLLVLSIFFSFFTYSFFWYENAPTIRSGKNAGKRLARLIPLGFLSGVFSVMTVIATFPFGFIASLWRPRTLSPSQPVLILIHGLYHNPSAFALLSRRLKKAGYQNVFVPGYRSLFTSFEDVLEKCGEQIRRVRAQVPGAKFILIGHSLGGLVSRVYAERASGEDVPAALITLGTPHQGSKMAAFGIGRLAESLMFRGPLFEELERAGLDLPCPGVAIVSPVDNLVIPTEGLEPPSPGWATFETAPVSHVGMLYSSTTARQVLSRIQEITVS